MKRGPGRPRKNPSSQQSEVALSIRAQYDAAGNGRRMRGWAPPSSGPNRAIKGIQNIRNRARDASRNDWSGESGTQKWTTSLIGIGIVPRFKRITDKARKQKITDWWSDFVKQSDADCVLNWYGQQTLAARNFIEAGEVFARRRDRRTNGGLPIPVQVQLLEAEMCPLLDSDNWPGLPAGNKIRSGIELNAIGQRVAYWFYKDHPGDGLAVLSSINSTLLVRVTADQVRHVFMPTRPGQLRGVSSLAPLLARLRTMGDYDDAVMERQKLANLFMAFIKQTLPLGDDIDPMTGKSIEYDTDDTPIAEMGPGMTQELGPGQEVQFANPPEPGTMYHEYMRTQNMGTAAGAGLPYEVFSGDIRNVSDRTLRVIIQEFRRFAEQRQWQVIIPMLCQPVVEWFADTLLFTGKVTQDEADAIGRCEHAPHGWEHIHPVQDPQGKKIEVDAGFRSRSSVIAERGDDPDDVDAERAADQQREQDAGLWDMSPDTGVSSGKQPGGAGAPAPAPGPAPAPAPKGKPKK